MKITQYSARKNLDIGKTRDKKSNFNKNVLTSFWTSHYMVKSWVLKKFKNYNKFNDVDFN